MAHFHHNALIGASGQGGYQIERSLRFNSADSAYLNRTYGTSTNQSIFTCSVWVKLCRAVEATTTYGELLNGYTAGNDTGFGEIFFYNGKLRFGAWNSTWRETTQIFRDPSAWYHIVVATDTTLATAANRVKIYVNGSEVTVFTLNNNPAQNATVGINNNSAAVRIGLDNPASSARVFDGYMADVNFIDGQQLTPSSFGETDTITGVWKPKKYSGTYGTNGFYLKFADNSGTTSTTLGKDSSGNGNNWTPNNFSVTAGSGNDSLIDTPTPYADGGNGRGNYCTGNPLHTGGTTWSNGNLDFSLPSGTGNGQGTISVATGKWYWEMSYTAQANDTGVQQSGVTTRRTNAITYAADGSKYVNGTLSAYGATYTTSDVIGVALDMDSSSVTFYKNNVSQGSISLSGVGITYASITISAGGGVTSTGSFNFGQRAFAYTPPSGFKALNTQNLPEPTIKKPSSYMDVKLYTGTSASQTISGLGFSPDLVWIKSRSNAYNHGLQDTVRGAGKTLYSNLTNAEDTQTSVTAFNSDGFSLANDSWNQSAVTYAAWCWDESATPGFDIVTYTGQTGDDTNRAINHSLGVTPNLIIIKNRNWAATNAAWAVWHSANTTQGLLLDVTDGSSSTIYNEHFGAQPSSTTFTTRSGTGVSVGNRYRTNGRTDGYVAYLWSEVAGFSKFGSYTGNGSTDGPFVFCGFRPRWVMMKSSSINGSNWRIFDTARDPANVMIYKLSPNNSDAEYTDANTRIDFTSNGFKLRETAGDMNSSGATYVFAAFAEFPAKYSLAR